jgi:Spy/CpxP family protein refolding chaperone
MRALLTFTFSGLLALGIGGMATAQDNAPRQGPSQARQGIHGPRSIDQELDHLTKDLELTPKQRKQVRPLLEEHHDKIQALIDKNPTLSREALGPQIHAISDETHHQIETLLTDHQKELAKAMQKRMHAGSPDQTLPVESLSSTH